MVRPVPVTDEDGVVTGRIRKWDGDEGPTEDSESAEATGRLVEVERGEVEVAANLVLYLQNIGEVLAWWNWAVGS